jgi:hypothetical protein
MAAQYVATGMNWFRKHLKLGSRLALLALVLQFVLSFGHFHPVAAQAAPALQTALAQADLATAANLTASAQPRPFSNHDSDQPPTNACEICAVIALANSVLFATPPVLLLPQAIELVYLAAETGFAHFTAMHPAFHSRAPPLS